MQRLNFRIVQRFWQIAKPYWFSEEKWKARGLLLLLVVILLAYTGLSVLLNTERGELISSLSERNPDRFWRTVWIFLGILTIYAPLFAGNNYLRDRLGLMWRRWLTGSFLDRYFGDRAYYDLNHTPTDIDNPDQRISQDIKSFTVDSLRFLLLIVQSLLQVIAFSTVLWTISKPLVSFLLVYAIVGSILATFVFGKPLVRLNFEQLKKEANFRFGLIRIRENSESIAFYRGEEQESAQVKDLFMEAFANFKRLIFWEFSLNNLKNFYEFIPYIIPPVVLAGSVFSGDLEVGKITEAQGAFLRVFFSLNIIVDRLDSLTNFGAGVERLYDFFGYLEQRDSEETEATVIETKTSDRIAIEHLTLQTPNYKKTLVEDLTLEVPPQVGLLVVGPSGCGKSSLLRAIAQLWKSGKGAIARPPLEQILFLPQKPYTILGSLRDQLLYPHGDSNIEDDKLHHILEQVNLPDLAERFGGLDARENWSEVLSLGEQQRLTFARLLINDPPYAILDEATSALDIQNEERLYQSLQATQTTYISVGHRPTLRQYHHLILELSEDRSWTVEKLSNPT